LTQAANGQLIIRASEVEYEYINSHDYQIAFNEIFYGRLKDFVDTYGNPLIKSVWNKYDPSINKLLEV
jgi:hypothetical protein